MNQSEFKKEQAKNMRKVAIEGRKAFLAKFKTKEELSEYMRSLFLKRKKK